MSHKLDEINGIKNEFYNQFKDKEWFSGAGLYRVDKKEFCIMALVREKNLEDIPESFKGIEVKKLVVI